MILQTIRTYLPQGVRTEQQDLLIGDACLALTDKEREEIENLNFENYQYNSPQRAEVSARVADAIYRAQLAGAATGAATGALGGGAAAWKTTNSLPITALGGAAGGITGGISGYYAGEKIGHRRVVTDITNSPEYHKWKNEKYETIIFPALSRYMDPSQYENFQLICPITLDFMLEPVQARDNHIYEKSAILAHLAAWRSRLPFDFDSLPQERRQELLKNSSSFRIAHVTKGALKPLPDYYKKIFHELIGNYNNKVLAQQSIVDLANEQFGPLTEQSEKIVQLYSMTQRERTRIKNAIEAELLNIEDNSDIELEEMNSFLIASAKLPRLLMPTG